MNITHRLPLALTAIIFTIALAYGGYTLGAQQSQPVEVTAFPTATPRAGSLAIPQQPVGTFRYLDQYLQFGFYFPDDLTVTKCADDPCFSLSETGVHGNMLGSYDISALDDPDGGMSLNIYCDASGPTGYQECADSRMEDFTNAAGTHGYKILRTKTVVTIGKAAEIYDDVAYIFPLSKMQQGVGLQDYVAVMMSVEKPTPENLATLNAVAQRVFIY